MHAGPYESYIPHYALLGVASFDPGYTPSRPSRSSFSRPRDAQSALRSASSVSAHCWMVGFSRWATVSFAFLRSSVHSRIDPAKKGLRDWTSCAGASACGNCYDMQVQRTSLVLDSLQCELYPVEVLAVSSVLSREELVP